ncbi:MAG: Sjogren's syndrome/scleroderma autoantigen 1 family protein, partial [Nitrososphaeraceae archaeon]
MDSRPNDVNSERKSNMKDAASFLLRGGSLLSTPCGICNGVQIRYKGNISCINCGKQQQVDETSARLASELQVSNVKDQSSDHHSFSLRAFEG